MHVPLEIRKCTPRYPRLGTLALNQSNAKMLSYSAMGKISLADWRVFQIFFKPNHYHTI